MTTIVPHNSSLLYIPKENVSLHFSWKFGSTHDDLISSFGLYIENDCLFDGNSKNYWINIQPIIDYFIENK